MRENLGVLYSLGPDPEPHGTVSMQGLQGKQGLWVLEEAGSGLNRIA